jgi:hypothetical protein
LEDLVELALSRPLMAGLRVLDDEDHRQGERLVTSQPPAR